MRIMLSAPLLLCVAATVGLVSASSDYGADISFPMHYRNLTINYPWLPWNVDPSVEVPAEYKGMPIQPLGDKRAFYDDYLQGCIDQYGNKGERCIQNEKDRIEMSLRQPQSMINYTETGFMKIRAPDHVFRLIKDFWEENKHKAKNESWPAGNTYTNHWASHSKMVSVEDPTMKGGGFVLKQHIWNTARETIEAWTGQKLVQCSLYGIRIYYENAVLATHVDRLPLVSSAIINVDQDVDEPWPLEVIGHDGKAHNVTMLPGDLVLYESHSILHGRPFPLKGRFMANIFIHFEPIGPIDGEILYGKNDLPPYVIPGSLEEENWRKRNPDGHNIMRPQEFATGSTEAHKAAMEGNVFELERAVKNHEESINAKDANGWTPLHEGIRNGNIDIVRFLLDKGSDMNARTGKEGELGGTALWWAQMQHPGDHPVVELLRNYGAKFIAPGEKTEL